MDDIYNLNKEQYKKYYRKDGSSGLFISFEGGEGGGKGTQITLLKQYLESKKYEVVVAREPGGVELSEKIRELLLDAKYEKLPLTEMFLYEAARTEFTHRIAKPVLNRGGIFLADRFYDSTTTYQGYAGGIDIDFVKKSNLMAADGIVPQLTFFLYVPVDIGLERAKNSKKEFENGDWQELKPKSFHEKVLEGYMELSRTEKRFKLIDCTQPVENVHTIIKNYVDKEL
jgi:dTMP kinase